MKAKIIVRLKSTVHDPQGEAIWQSFQHLGYGQFTGVRQGKVFDLEFQEMDKTEARKILEEIARKVLTNPIIEEYSIEMGEEK
jgi:phosphoribosylformylglycinamidine synthase subunit PurS